MSALLEAIGISVRFSGLVALDDVALQVEDGEVHGLIGPNGAGKSTLLNVLTGIYRPNGGKVTFLGHDLLARQPHQIATMGLARTFQNVQLFTNQSVLQNVMTARHAHLRSGLVASAFRLGRQRSEERLAEQEAMRCIEFLGLAVWADRRAGDLSFGWQRRVSLARAMATNPKLLLLDEPTAGMNPTVAHEMAQLIGKLRDTGITILLIEHNMPLVMSLCDRITVLDRGRKIAEGAAKEIQSDANVVAAYLGERGQRAAALRG